MKLISARAVAVLFVCVMTGSALLWGRQLNTEMVRSDDGPVLVFKNGTRPTYAEFAREPYDIKSSFGFLGGPEANMSFNMDYADNVHRFYDPTYNALWWTLNNNGATLQFAPAGTPADIWHNAGKSLIYINNAGDVEAYNGFKERGRSFDLGDRQTPTFDAGDYTSSTGSWTVASGNVTINYTLIGKLMIVNFNISGTSVSGTPAELRMDLPSGLTAAVQASVPISINDNGTKAVGLGYIATGGAFLRFYKDIGATGTWATSSSSTGLSGTMFFFVS